MNDFALDRLAEYLHSRQIRSALLADPGTVTWLTGYAPPIQAGPSPFECGPALAWWNDGRLTLLASNLESAAAKASGVEVVEYVGYTIEGPLEPLAKMGAALTSVIKGDGPGRGEVAVEWGSLPAPLLACLEEALPETKFQPMDGNLANLRAVKSDREIEKLRAVVRLCDQAQIFMREHIQAGQTEIGLWGAVKGHLEASIGARLPVLVDLVAGRRTAEIGGPPGTYRLSEGDPVMLDFVPRLDGYWGDNTDTRFVGQPSAALEKVRRAVRQALRTGIDAVRPGTPAREVDRVMRAAIESGGYPVYPHHSGHGIGVTYHEEPRIVPYNELPLEAGMTIALEPGIYLPDVGGVRLEDVVLVTADGCEVMTRHLTSD